MSATITPAAPPEPLLTPQVIIGLVSMAIAGGTIATVLYQGDPQLRSQALVGAIGYGGTILGWFFGSSKGSQAKDQTIAAQAAAASSAPAAPPAPAAPAAAP